MSNPFRKEHLPVFPLNTVVFIGSTLQLQIFEQRYLNMIKTCMKNQHGFITTLIRHGHEVNDIPEIYDLGTYVDIIDWNMLDNNLLSITVKGQQRARIHNTRTHHDNLISADLEYLDNLKKHKEDILDEELLALLKALSEHPFVSAKYPDMDFSSTVEIAYKLCELLPSSNTDKQQLLEAEHTQSLADHLKTIVAQLENP